MKKQKNNDVNFNKLEDLVFDKNFSKISKIHKYWSRKPWFVIDEYIKKYSKKNDLILDPFFGSGIIGLETILNERNFIGYDLNPFAVFLAKNTLNTKFDCDSVMNDFENLSKKIKHKINKTYSIDKEKIILYSIIGDKNTKEYNAVVSDSSYKNKEKVIIKEEYLTPKIRFPKNLLFPDASFPAEFYKDRFSYKGIKKVSDMFSRRNLFCNAILFEAINEISKKNRDIFLLAFSNTLLHTSKLKSENVRPLGVNNYWVPDDFIEENVWWRFEERFKNVIEAKKIIQNRANKVAVGNFQLLNKSSLSMVVIDDESIDYVITDPPYGDTIQYSELSFIWNCWLSKKFKIKEEVIINPTQKKGFDEYSKQLKCFISEISRVLKPKGYFTLCFQNKNVQIWSVLAEYIRDGNFVIQDISSYEPLGSPYNRNWAKFSPKSDFYVTFRKAATKKKTRLKQITPQEISRLVSLHNPDLQKTKNISKYYDLFIAELLNKIFDGYEIIDHENLNIKKIIQLF